MSAFYYVFDKLWSWLFDYNVAVFKAHTSSFQIEIFMEGEGHIQVLNERPLWIIANGNVGLLDKEHKVEAYTRADVPDNATKLPILFKPRKSFRWVSKTLPVIITRLPENKQCPKGVHVHVDDPLDDKCESLHESLHESCESLSAQLD